MTALTESAIRDFLFAQTDAWNRRDKDAFMELYRAHAAQGLTLEYMGKALLTGEAAWAGLNGMWDQYVPKVRQQLFEVIVNGTDAACYYRNIWTAEQTLSTGMEFYAFKDGALHIRMFH